MGVIAWIYNDELMTEYPYEEMQSYSKIEGGMRLFPVFGPVRFKPLEWEPGKIFLTAKSVDGAVFTIRKDAPFRLATWSTIGDVKYLGNHPSPEAAKEIAQALHDAEVAKYLTD